MKIKWPAILAVILAIGILVLVSFAQITELRDDFKSEQSKGAVLEENYNELSNKFRTLCLEENIEDITTCQASITPPPTNTDPEAPLVGPPGPTGAVGPQGPRGFDGEDGRPGSDGEDGASGTNGIDGADGVNGTDGEDGAQGEQGEQGAQGPEGPIGPAGPQGEQGPTGPPGPPGPAGSDAPTYTAGSGCSQAIPITNVQVLINGTTISLSCS